MPRIWPRSPPKTSRTPTARALLGLSKDMQTFYHEVFAMLLLKTK